MASRSHARTSSCAGQASFSASARVACRCCDTRTWIRMHCWPRRRASWPSGCSTKTRRRRGATSIAGSRRAKSFHAPDARPSFCLIFWRINPAALMDYAAAAKRINAYERLIRLDKPVGALLLLWPTLWAVWIASRGQPPLDIFLVFLTGTILMRSAGCALNDWADRDFDGRVARTRDRPLAAGEIAPREALIVAAALAAIAFLLVLYLNRFAILLSV